MKKRDKGVSKITLSFCRCLTGGSERLKARTISKKKNKRKGLGGKKEESLTANYSIKKKPCRTSTRGERGKDTTRQRTPWVDRRREKAQRARKKRNRNKLSGPILLNGRPDAAEGQDRSNISAKPKGTLGRGREEGKNIAS